MTHITKFILFEDVKHTKFPSNYTEKLKFTTGISDAKKYFFYIIDNLLETKNMIKLNSNVKSIIEVMFSKMCRLV